MFENLCGVLWPSTGDPLARLLGQNLGSVSDHRPVFLDVLLLPLIGEAVSGLSVEADGNQVALKWKTQPG